LSNQAAGCAAGFKSMDQLSDTLVIGGTTPVKPGATAVLIPKSAKKQAANTNDPGGKTDDIQIKSSPLKTENNVALPGSQVDFKYNASDRTAQLSPTSSVFKQAAEMSVAWYIQTLTASAKQTGGQTKSLSLFTMGEENGAIYNR